MSVARHHAEWLSLVESSGPFLSMPVLLRAFPQGLDARESDRAARLREAYEEWLDKKNEPAVHRTWVQHVLRDLLEYPSDLLAEGQTIPPGLESKQPQFGETLRPDWVLKHRDAGGRPQLLISLYPPSQKLDGPVAGKVWKATPGTRMMELLHSAAVPLGLVTNGEQWMLVYAPQGETTGFASWYADLWMQEPITLRAFTSLLHLRRFLGVAPDQTLPALFAASSKDQQEVTDQLGYQVRRAVEMLVQAFDRIDVESGRQLLAGMLEKELYDGALTVMMRLVFLFSAEERKLLLLGDPLYDQHYAVSTLSELLRERADQHGEEVLERRHDAWCRLLATFRAVHAGVQHESMRLLAYGGTLFHPDRYPFLEGRAKDTKWTSTAAKPPPINNRVVLHLLEALQLLRVKVPGGGPAEARRLSFRALDIEQIGHVYEGLLDHTAKRAPETILGLAGAKDKEPEIPLSKLEEVATKGTADLVEYLHEETGKSDNSLTRLINDPSEIDEHTLLIACGQDARLLQRVKPFAALLREDSFGQLVVIPEGSVYVTRGSDRRSTGTHYTPRSLTEPIVQYTLEPLVYVGPAEGKPKEEWRLKSPKELLDLKVCDMAMGSGAFLVQACRYLAERLVEAWEKVEKGQAGTFVTTPEGELSTGSVGERLIPADAAERIAIARRTVADRCLYGVDVNQMAVEMAKLSLWLITLQRDRPFTFLDHALKCGDSLLGVSSLEQIENFSLRSGPVQTTISTVNLFRYIEDAAAKRRDLENLPSNDHGQIEAKTRLHVEAEAAMAKVKALAACLIAFEMRGLDGEKYESLRDAASANVQHAMEQPLAHFQAYTKLQLGNEVLRPFHWPLEFCEVFQNGGFTAILTNPPFAEGATISEVQSDFYRTCFEVCGADNTGSPSQSSKINLVSLFVERILGLVKGSASFGFVAPKPILRNERYWRVRQIFLERARPLAVFSFPNTAFAAASVEPCAIVATRQPKASEQENLEYAIIDLADHSHGADVRLGRLSDVLGDERYTIRIESHGGLIDVCSRIEKAHGKLEDAFETKDGVNPGRKDFRSVFLGKKVGDNFVPLVSLSGVPYGAHALAEPEPFNPEKHKPTINGRDFDEFSSIAWDGVYLRYDSSVAYVEDYFVKGTRWSAQLREKSHYDRPVKVVSRQTASTLIATIDDQQHFPLNTVHVHFPMRGQTEICCIALAGILNSTLLRFIYKVKSEEVGKVFPQVHISRLRSLPLPIRPSIASMNSLRRVVETLLASGVTNAGREALDSIVFELYKVNPTDRAIILASMEAAS